MNNDFNNSQLNLVDMLSVVSMLFGLVNYNENSNQGDKQVILSSLAEQADVMLKDINGHLLRQDEKLDDIIERLERLDRLENDS